MATKEWLEEHDRRQALIRQQQTIDQERFIKQSQELDRLVASLPPLPKYPDPEPGPSQFSSSYSTYCANPPSGHSTVHTGGYSENRKIPKFVVGAAGLLAWIAVCVMIFALGGSDNSQHAPGLGLMIALGAGWILRRPLKRMRDMLVFGIVMPIYKAGRWVLHPLKSREIPKSK